MDWPATRAEIKTILEAVAVTDPAAETIKRVYEFAPLSIQDVPCIIVYNIALPQNDRPSQGFRVRRLDVRLRVVALDADAYRAINICNSFAIAVADEFDSQMTVNGNATGVFGPTFDEAFGWELGGKRYIAQDLVLGVEFKDVVSFTA